MSAKNGKPELVVPDPLLMAGNTFMATGRFWKFDNGAFVNDNTTDVIAFVAAKDHHVQVPEYNPLPVHVTAVGEDGRRVFTLAGDAIRPSLLRSIFRGGGAFLTVIQPGVARVSVPLTVAR